MSDLIEIAQAELAHEMGRDSEAREEQRWLRWLSRVEVLLGLDTLDGDQSEDGYSLDVAYDRFRAGDSPSDACAYFQDCIAGL